MKAKPSRFTRLCSALLLGSVLLGVLAPGAVAFSRTDIQQVAGTEGLSSDVQDFLNGVLEDAMLRAANVAPASSSGAEHLRPSSDYSPFVIVPHGALESVRSGRAPTVHATLLPPGVASAAGFGELSPRAP